nr:Na+/H+ antiporter NhaA [uncultured Desulfobacter sp.]
MQKDKESIIASFFKMESTGGMLLFCSAVLAIVIANSVLDPYYKLFISTPVEIRVGPLEIAKPLLLWINDGLMAIFFFLVGLELKREVLEGELSEKSKIILPGIGAVGGMLIPALIYLYFNGNDAVAVKGWAIPAATDIGAIIIIALFYTSKISFFAICVVILCLPVLFYLNRRNITSNSPYLLMGTIMWVATLKSGIHATLAGVVLAMFIPMRSKSNPEYSPLASIEHDLYSIVAFFVLPMFAFANAGINLSGVTVEQAFHGVPIGVALGLFLGKQIGLFGFCWFFIKLKLAKLPDGMNFLSLYGTSALCGIGFTMSLFIGSLAFEETGVNLLFDERLGIIIGSLLSGILGFFVLRVGLRGDRQ